MEIYNRIYKKSDTSPIVLTAGDDYTHAVIMNKAMPPLSVPKENVIGFAFEPLPFLHLTSAFVEYAKKHIGRYYIGDLPPHLSLPFVEHHGFMWHGNPHREIPLSEKSKVMSIVVSKKQFAPGHKYRHALTRQIVEKKLPIDIFGYGSEPYQDETDRVKGPFKQDYEPYGPYLFSICIENHQTNDYISEKIVTPALHNCHPIYWGARHVDRVLDNVLCLSGDIDTDILLLEKILQDPYAYYQPMYTPKHISQLNVFEHIEDVFKKT
jgi:hypothetical protein